MSLVIIFSLVLGILVYVAVNHVIKIGKTESSIDLSETLLSSKEDIHAEIAKTVEEIKAKDPIVIEAPFVTEKVKEDKPKKKTVTKPSTKKVAKTSAVKKSTKTVTKKSTKK